MLKICIIITVILLNKILASDLPKEEPRKPSWQERVYHNQKNTSIDLMINYRYFEEHMQQLTTFANKRDEKNEILGIISKVPFENWKEFSKCALSICALPIIKMTYSSSIKIKLIKILTAVKPGYYEELINNLIKTNEIYYEELINNLITVEPEDYQLLLEKIDGWSSNQ